MVGEVSRGWEWRRGTRYGTGLNTHRRNGLEEGVDKKKKKGNVKG